jgi:anti-sigma B factor antagonist
VVRKMHVHVEHGRTFTLVRPIGSFYGGGETRELERNLGIAVDGGSPVVVIDLARTRDLNSTAIGVLVGAYRRASTRGAELRLCNVQSDLQSVLTVIKLVNVIPVFDSLEKALTAPLRQDATAPPAADRPAA